MVNTTLGKAVEQFNKIHKFDIVRVVLGSYSETFQVIKFRFAFEMSQYGKDIIVGTTFGGSTSAFLGLLEKTYVSILNDIKVLEGVS